MSFYRIRLKESRGSPLSVGFIWSLLGFYTFEFIAVDKNATFS